MGAWDKYDKQKVNKKSAWSDYDKNDTKRLEDIKLEKQERISQGLPVSVRDDRAAPTGGGEMLRGIIGLGADVLANARNAGRIITGQEEKPVFKSRYLGDVKGLGKFDFTKSPFEKENLKTLIKSASTGAEIASYLNATGVAKSTVANLTKQGVLASKKTFAEWAVKMMPELAKEGFGQGIAYTLGSQGREYAETSKPFSGKQAIIDVATSTLGNVVIPTALQKMFGKSTNKIMAARAAERVLSDTEILGRKIPDAGVPSAKYMTESGRTLPAPRKPNEIPIEMPSPEIAASQRRLNEVPKVETPDIIKKPEILRAEKFHSKQDFINNEIGFYTRTKQKIPNNITERSSKIWDEAHTTPKQQPLAPLPKQEIPTQQVGQDIPNTKTIPEQPNVKQATPEQSRIETPETRADIEKKIKSLDEDEVTKDFTPQQKKQNIEYFNSIEGNESKVKNIAMGLDDDIPEGVNPNSIWKLLSDKADSMGDGNLALELSQSPLRKKISVEAQNLSMTNIGDKGVGLTKKIEIINKKLKDMVSKNIDIDSQTIKEVDNIKENVAKILKESKVDMKYVDEILEGIRCK